ncbi:MAG: hypothetical protein ACXV4B_07845 [Halobacteriota archaeon]
MMYLKKILLAIVVVYLIWLTLLIILGLGLGSILFFPGYIFAIPIVIIIRRIKANRPVTHLWVACGTLSLALMIWVAGIPLWQWIANGYR